VLGQLIAEKFGLPLTVPRHREEAAFGAALLASVGAGIHPDLASAGNLIRYF
jgi:ribulose kinase